MKNRGFSLVDLVASVAAVAVLGAAVGAAISTSSETYRRQVCRLYQCMIVRACNAYAQDNDGRYPASDGMHPAKTFQACFNGIMLPPVWTEEDWKRVAVPGRMITLGQHEIPMPGFYCYRGLGLLHKSGEEGRSNSDHPARVTGYVNPKAFFCPSDRDEFSMMTPHYWLRKEFHQDANGKWIMFPEAPEYPARYISFMYNVMTKEWGVEDGVSGSPTDEEMIGRAVVADQFTYGNFDHGGDLSGYWFAMPDASVQWYSGTDIRVGSYPSPENPGEAGTAEEVAESWRKLYDSLQ